MGGGVGDLLLVTLEGRAFDPAAYARRPAATAKHSRCRRGGEIRKLNARRQTGEGTFMLSKVYCLAVEIKLIRTNQQTVLAPNMETPTSDGRQFRPITQYKRIDY